MNGFKPVLGQTFEILRFASASGTFAHMAGLDIGGGLYLRPSFTATNLSLTVVNTPRPQFSPPHRSPDGTLLWTLSEVAGRTFVIQASADLLHWDNLATNVNSGISYQFQTGDPLVYPHRFYRTSEP